MRRGCAATRRCCRGYILCMCSEWTFVPGLFYVLSQEISWPSPMGDRICICIHAFVLFKIGDKIEPLPNHNPTIANPTITQPHPNHNPGLGLGLELGLGLGLGFGLTSLCSCSQHPHHPTAVCARAICSGNPSHEGPARGTGGGWRNVSCRLWSVRVVCGRNFGLFLSRARGLFRSCTERPSCAVAHRVW